MPHKLTQSVRGYLPPILYATLLILLGCGPMADTNHAGAGDSPPAIAVEIISVIRGDIDANYYGTATLVAAEEALVVAKVGGTVEEILVEEGDEVEAGQTLAHLDDQRLQLEKDRAKAKLNQLSADYKRSQSMFKKKLVSVEKHEQLRFELARQKAEYKLARLSLNNSKILAPFAGIVSERLIKIGNMVPINTATFRITQLDHLQAMLHVPERAISKLAAGQPVITLVDAWPGEWFIGKVERISPLVDASTGTVRIIVTLIDDSRRLRPGMFGRLRIRYERHRNALLIPKNAVLSEDDEQAVFIVASNQMPQGNTEPNPAKSSLAERKVVTTGFSDQGLIEILSGLTDTDQVIITGQTTLKAGATIEVVNPPPPTPSPSSTPPQAIGLPEGA